MAAIGPKTVTLKNGLEVCIRTPVAEDALSVIKYLKAVFVDDRFFMTTEEEAQKWQEPEKEQKILQENYLDEKKLMLATEMNQQIISLSNVHAGERNRNRHVGQMGISILPEYRGNGLGMVFMQTMIDWASAHPVIEKLALGVWADNAPAIALYEKMGFIEEGRKVREVKYADGSYDNCILMHRFVE